MGNRKSTANPTIRSSTTLSDSAAAIDVSPDGQTICAASFDGHVSLFDANTLRHRRDVAFHKGGALATKFDPTGNRLLTGGQDGVVSVVDVRQGVIAASIASALGPVSQLAWASDGRHFASSSGRALRIHTADGTVVSEVSDHASTILSLHDCDALDAWISVCYGGVHRIGRATKTREQVFFARTSLLTAQVSSCGRFLAAGAQEPTVFIWDLHHDDECVHLQGYRGKVGLLQWCKDPAILATASGNAVVLWSFADGDPHAVPHVELEPHPARVLSLGFSEDGHRLWTGCADGILRSFDLTKSTAPLFALDIGAPVHLLRAVGQSVFIAATNGTLTAASVSRTASKVARKTRAESRVSP
jgi:WD40 repeat protein